jgi:NADH dehydrogenase
MHGFAGVGGVSPASVDRDGNFHLIEAASSVGAAFILMSVVGAAADHPMELFRAKHAAEERLRASGLPWTIVRATAFMETWAGIMAGPLRTRGTIPVFGRGTNPINFVSAGDVAAIVALVTSEPSLRGRVIEWGGPDNVTFNQLAAVVQEVIGSPGRVRHIPRSMLRLMSVLAAPVKPAFARQARAAVIMDTHDMRFDANPARREFPTLPSTNLASGLRALLLDPATGMRRSRFQDAASQHSKRRAPILARERKPNTLTGGPMSSAA